MATQGPSLYNECRDETGKELELLPIGKNLFKDLAEKIAREINVSNCWLCGGTLMSEEWS
jgi:hypothetical protein